MYPKRSYFMVSFCMDVWEMLFFLSDKPFRRQCSFRNVAKINMGQITTAERISWQLDPKSLNHIRHTLTYWNMFGLCWGGECNRMIVVIVGLGVGGGEMSGVSCWDVRWCWGGGGFSRVGWQGLMDYGSDRWTPVNRSAARGPVPHLTHPSPPPHLPPNSLSSHSIHPAWPV